MRAVWGVAPAGAGSLPRCCARLGITKALTTAVTVVALLSQVVDGQVSGRNITFEGSVIFCEDTPRICEKGGTGTFVPTDDEYKWSKGGRGILYALILSYLFAGVALLADAFMNSIETITAKEKVLHTVDLSGRPVQFSVRIWNPTVANLTLMALGSSAPEIILSIIEVIFNDFYSGDLGPGTIVGSAAFNLFFILGICSYSLGSEIKHIESTGVFTVTAIFAVLAYVWLIVILEGPSPNAIEIWEAVMTLAWFPILVIIAYKLDVKRHEDKKVTPQEREITLISNSGKAAHMNEEDVKMKSHERGLSPEEEDKVVVARLLEARQDKGPPSRAYYRRLAKQNRHKRKQVRQRMSISVGRGVREFANVASEVGFGSMAYVGSYADGHIDVVVKRDGALDRPCIVIYETQDEIATAGHDYEAMKGTLEFGVGVGEQTIRIPILPVDQAEKVLTSIDELDDTFQVVLVRAELSGNGTDSVDNLVALRNSVCTVHLATNKTAGNLQLECVDYKVLESQAFVTIKVIRIGGTRGKVSVDYATKDGTAIATKDYFSVSDTLVFEDGVTEKSVTIEIIDDEVYEKDEIFYFTISNPTGGGLGRFYEAAITIVNDDVMTSKLDKLKSLLRINEDRVNQVAEKWGDQFDEALTVPDEGIASLSGFLWVIMMPWSLVLAVLPPPTLAGGWLLFVVSLSCTGIVTALIGDYAALLGCTIGLSDYVTAITIVALGTSLPDTFASVLAAKTDDHADAAIVNVTGSNSVNVFLGLGVAWTIGAIYWEGRATNDWRTRIACRDPTVVLNHPKGVFYVSAGTLSFSVAVYSVCATISLVYMSVNRRIFGGELGGPKRILFFVIQLILWGIYILLSSLRSEGIM